MTSSISRRTPHAPTFGPLSTVRYAVNGVSFDMVRVPPGRFIDGWRSARRELLVSQPFELGVTLVTQALWRAVMGASPSNFQGDDRPVEQVSWDDAQELMVALANRSLPGFRLPTEAEWVWAARCGVPTCWAGAERSQVAAVLGSNQTKAVAGLSGSATGAFDFSGNVGEWAGDRYGQLLTGVDVQGPASGPRRVRRGGSWAIVPGGARVLSRGWAFPSMGSTYIGLRLLRTAP
jgi:formylglycine-generating enzyme required for sulfatase activity